MTIKAAVDARKKERDGLRARIAELEAMLQANEAHETQLSEQVTRLCEALKWALPWVERFPIPAHDQDFRDRFAAELEQARAALGKRDA